MRMARMMTGATACSIMLLSAFMVATRAQIGTTQPYLAKSYAEESAIAEAEAEAGKGSREMLIAYSSKAFELHTSSMPLNFPTRQLSNVLSQACSEGPCDGKTISRSLEMLTWQPMVSDVCTSAGKATNPPSVCGSYVQQLCTVSVSVTATATVDRARLLRATVSAAKAVTSATAGRMDGLYRNCDSCAMRQGSCGLRDSSMLSADELCMVAGPAFQLPAKLTLTVNKGGSREWHSVLEFKCPAALVPLASEHLCPAKPGTTDIAGVVLGALPAPGPELLGGATFSCSA